MAMHHHAQIEDQLLKEIERCRVENEDLKIALVEAVTKAEEAAASRMKDECSKSIEREENQLSEREKRLNEREASVIEREAKLNERELLLVEREAALDKRELTIKGESHHKLINYSLITN